MIVPRYPSQPNVELWAPVESTFGSICLSRRGQRRRKRRERRRVFLSIARGYSDGSSSYSDPSPRWGGGGGGGEILVPGV